MVISNKIKINIPKSDVKFTTPAPPITGEELLAYLKIYALICTPIYVYRSNYSFSGFFW